MTENMKLKYNYFQNSYLVCDTIIATSLNAHTLDSVLVKCVANARDREMEGTIRPFSLEAIDKLFDIYTFKIILN